MSNPSADNLSLEDKVSYVGPKWGPTGRDDASYEPNDDDNHDVEDVTPAADDASEASSSFSLPADMVDVSCLLDLLDERQFCLVRMTKHDRNVQTACVCGNPAGGCCRSGHNAKKSLGSATTVAQPGYYQEYIDSKGNPSGVGLANKRWFTVDEYRQLQCKQAEERLQASQPNPDFVEPELAPPGPNTVPVCGQQTTQEPIVYFGLDTTHKPVATDKIPTDRSIGGLATLE